jgi:hypothetical protein
MKVTKQELQKIIKEELDAMTVAGELEEGFLDKLLGKEPRFGDFVTDDDVKKKLDVVQKNLGDLRGLASKQDNKELGLQVTKISNDVANLYGKTTPKGPELKRMTDKPEDISNFNAMDDLSDPKAKTSLSNDRLLRILKNKAPEISPPRDAKGQIDREKLIDLVGKVLKGLPDARKYGNVPVRGRRFGPSSIPVAKLEE